MTWELLPSENKKQKVVHQLLIVPDKRVQKASATNYVVPSEATAKPVRASKKSLAKGDWVPGAGGVSYPCYECEQPGGVSFKGCEDLHFSTSEMICQSIVNGRSLPGRCIGFMVGRKLPSSFFA